MNTFAVLAAQLARILRPLAFNMQTEDGIRSMMAYLGWTLPAMPPSLPILGQLLVQLNSSFSDLTLALHNADSGDDAVWGTDESPDISSALEQVTLKLALVITQFHALPNLLRTELPADFIATSHIDEEIENRIFDWLISLELSKSSPVLYRLLRVAGVIEVMSAGIDHDSFEPVFEQHRIHWDRLFQLLDPKSLAHDVYGWGTTDINTTRLFTELVPLSFALSMPAEFRYATTAFMQKTKPESILPPEPIPQLWIPVFQTDNLAFYIVATALAKASPNELQGLVLAFVPSGGVDISFSLSDELEFTLNTSAQIGSGAALILWPDRPADLVLDMDGTAGSKLTNGQITVALKWSAAEWQKPNGISGDDGTLVTANSFSIRLGIEASSGGVDPYAEFLLDQGKLVIAPPKGDSFLESIIPAKGLTAHFSMGIRWSKDGLHFQGSTGLTTSLLLHLTLGPVLLQSLNLTIEGNQEGLAAEASLTASIKLGPLLLTVEQMGLSTAVQADPGGNLGPLDVAIGFKPPSGVGLSIGESGFSGGGFLRFYEDDGRYEGLLELEFEDKLSLKAIGLITTKLPGGKDGFSLVIIITAEFTPIQLGLGFTLNGVGGMLGYNRTADVERLRSGVRDDSLSGVLFPQNIVENASRILSDLNQLFPAQEGRFIFGPMARIVWADLITIDLGLIIEVPSPVRLLILGVIRTVLPNEDEKLLQLQVNFLGVIDFGARKLSFDASLYNSKLLGYTLSGDMAVRMNWGDEPNFLLSVGGFHPAYQPPPLNLPVLHRITVQLTVGGNPRLTLESYYAVTSNSVQFGAKVELFAGSMSSFAVSGFLSYDVLFQFNPFHFIASIQAKVALLAGGSEIASVSLDFTLEGPTPWHVKGKASLKICWFLTITVPFDHTFGEVRDTRLDDIAVIPLLHDELSKPGNWEAQLLSGHAALVTTGKVKVAEGEVVASPFGALTIRQKVVPLGMSIQQVGSRRTADGSRFAISSVLVEGVALSQSDVEDQFAPAQFFEMSDADKLSSKKAFEAYPSGVKLEDGQFLTMAYGVTRVVDYELSYIDEQRDHLPKPEPVHPDGQSFTSWAVGGAVAASPLSQAYKAPSTLAPGKVQLQRELFRVVNASDLTPVADIPPATQAQAQLHLQQLLHTNPAQPDLLVVPLFEVNTL